MCCQAHSERVWTLDEEEEIKDVFVRTLGEVYPWKDFFWKTPKSLGVWSGAEWCSIQLTISVCFCPIHFADTSCHDLAYHITQWIIHLAMVFKHSPPSHYLCNWLLWGNIMRRLIRTFNQCPTASTNNISPAQWIRWILATGVLSPWSMKVFAWRLL